MNDHRAEGEQRIALRSFSQRLSAWPDDDWTGLSNPSQRRKLQNRVNQRARRLRNKGQPVSSTEDENDGLFQNSHSSAVGLRDSPLESTDAALPVLLRQIDDVRILQLDLAKTKAIMQRLEAMAHRHYMLGSPRTDILLHLIQLNFTKALMENTRVLGLTSDQLHDDALSPFNTAGPWQYDANEHEHSLPLSLRPTAVQRAMPHHPWLDLLPVPQMRDNLIRAEESYDEEALCLALKGYGSAHTGRTGIIVWKDPWDPAGWEVTEAFASSWGWVLEGCSDLFRSTNYWRAQRNEKPLFRTR